MVMVFGFIIDSFWGLFGCSVCIVCDGIACMCVHSSLSVVVFLCVCRSIVYGMVWLCFLCVCHSIFNSVWYVYNMCTSKLGIVCLLLSIHRSIETNKQTNKRVKSMNQSVVPMGQILLFSVKIIQRHYYYYYYLYYIIFE